MSKFRRKIVASILAATIILSSMATAVFADNNSTYQESANILKGYGVFVGDNGNLMLDQQLKRQDAVVISLRLMGKADEEFENYETPSDFTDIKDAYYAPIIGMAQDLGLVEGMGDGTFGFDQLITAQQLETILLRSLGYEITDEEYANVPQMAQELGITNLVSAAGNVQITRDLVAQMMLNALNTNVKDGNEKLGEKLGFVEKEAVAPVLSDVKSTVNADKTTITGKVTPATAKVKVAGADVTVGQDGTFSKEVTLVAGDNNIDVVATNDEKEAKQTVKETYTVATKLEVKSVNAINAKQIKVEFSTAVDKDSAETAGNYTGIALDSAVLQADGKTVILNATSAMTLYTETSITIADVKDLAGNKLASTNIKFTPVDTGIPTLVSAVAKGNQTLELTFSEPVQNGTVLGNYKLDDVVLGSGSISMSADKTVATIALASALLPGDHKVAVFADSTNDLKDYANYVVPADVKTVNVVSAATAANVATVTANSQTKVTVVFDRAVNVDTSADLAKFYWNTTGTVSENTKTADAIKRVDDKTYELTFTTYPLTAGKVQVFVKDIVDFYGNKIAGNAAANVAKTEITVTANALPTVASVTAKDDKTIVVKFSSDMKSSTVTNASNYTIKDKDNAIIAVNGVITYDTTAKEATVPTNTMSAGTYTVTIANVQDVLNNTVATGSYTINPTDTTAPTAPTVTMSDKVIAITFNEAMAVTGDHSILNAANYQFKPNGGSKGDLPAGVTLTAASNNKVVRIAFASARNAADEITIGYLKGSVSYNVADAAGNLMAYSADNAVGASKAALDINGGTVKVLSPTTLSLVGSQAFGSAVAGDFQVTKDNGTNWFSPTAAAIDTTDNTNKTIILTVADANKFTAADLGDVKIKTLGTTASTDSFGNVITINRTSAGASANKIAAAMVAATAISTTEVRVQFDAPVTAAAAYKNSLVLTQGTNNIAISAVAQGDSAKELKLTVGTVALDQALTLKTVAKDLITAVDDNSNLIKDNTTGIEAALTLVANDLTTTSASPVADTDTFVVVFNRNIDTNSIKANWDGTTTVSGTLTFKTDGTATFNGASIGTIKGFTVGSQEDVNADVTYNAGTRTLTITINDGSITGSFTHTPTALVFTPDANIKSTSGLAINTLYTPDSH